MLSADAQIKNFDEVGNLPVTWYLSADSLLAAAGFLKAHRDSYSPFEVKVGESIPDEGKILFPEIMLKGFAIECLLKALWLKRGNSLAVAGKYIGIPNAADHKLLQLSTAVKISMSTVEKDMLKRLSIIMVSVGRYPIARNWSATQLGEAGPPTYWSSPSDDLTLEGIVTSLKAQI